MFQSDILRLAAQVLEMGRTRYWRLATAEPCTPGLVALALTAAADSSDSFEHGFVAYSNEAKIELAASAASSRAAAR